MFTPKLQCDSCKARKCDSCNLINNSSSIKEKELYEKLWQNVEVVEIEGKQRSRCKYEYKQDINKVFAPEHANVREEKKNKIFN